LARTIVERRPTAVAYHMLGEQLSQAGQPDEAIDRLREAVRRGNSRAGYLLGVVLFNQGRTKESIERLDAFVRTAGVPQVPRWLEPPLDEILRARLVLGLAYLREGAFARAEEQAMGILAVAPRSVDGRGLLANALFGQERWTDAVREYRVYLAARPNDVQGLLNFGVSLVGSERLDDALPVFRRAVAIDPSDANAKRLLALAEADSAR
jgi:tetratricopeptide (TPR) repeat protein